MAQQWKEKGNEFFALRAYGSAIQSYSKAIALIQKSKRLNEKGIELFKLFSNRAAAYLKYGKAQLALLDAEESLKLNPKFGKAFGRKGRALYDLGKYQEAMDVYEEGLMVDKTNNSLREGFRECERKKEEVRREENDEYDEDTPNKSEGPQMNEDADLDAFLEEVEQTPKEKIVLTFPKKSFSINHTKQTEKWTSANQIDRLLQDNFKWFNLNPFEVFQLPHTATEDDLKRRYKKLSQLIHPDKQRDKSSKNLERAQLAFDELRKANVELRNKSMKDLVVRTITGCIERVRSTHERLLEKGYYTGKAKNEEEMKKELLKDAEVEIRKVFAEREMNRLKSEGMKRKYEQREREQRKEDYEYWQGIKNQEVKFRKEQERRLNDWAEFDKKYNTKPKKTKVQSEPSKEREEFLSKHKGKAGVDASYRASWR
eukprot:augustus_masked-scaffold_49-processed-gene-1.15-mRNA-1 protein AED:1.00 eAED:1.00 QI:0/-1/0/0/-1/1/1/0/427